MQINNIIIGERHCTLATSDQFSESCPTVICCMHEGLGTDDGRLQDATRVCSLMQEMTDKPFNLLCFDVASWDRFLSPWAYESFTGEASQTLDWILSQGIPYLGSCNLNVPVCIAGYSLAGLFAFWAARSTNVFSGVASCSGSIWYPNWPEFSAANPFSREAIAYLSLGGKESKTAHPVISTIENRTKEEFTRVQKEPLVLRSVLEMNAGGHFTKTLWRLAKGMAWLVDNLN